uniref:Major facilitator superfamily (MFS) profile domain-containing protein n=1 Tax=Bionectria ochroleuca TaxID=29856 RepID=A0A8H7N2S4_BIOOC
MATRDQKQEVEMLEESTIQKPAEMATSDVDPVAQKSLLRKLDFRMMPVFFVMYFLNHWDRNGLPQAKLNGITTHLDLKGTQYNTCISILYVGYLIAGIPSNMILTRVRPSIYLGVCMCGWAIVSGCTALSMNYIHLLMLRFLLGWFEAPFYPGAIYMLSRFYTKREVATRLAILYCGQLSSSAFSGLITAGIFASIDGRYGIHGWQWLFIIEGAATFGFALIAIFLLPDTPGKTSWMTPEENACSVIRMQEDSVNQLQHETPMQGFMSAIKDYKVWLFMLMQNMHFSAMSFNQFFPTLVKTLGYNNTITLVLTSPPYIFSALFSLALARSSGYFNDRTWHIVGGNLFAIVGFVLACATTGLAPRYAACFLFAAGSYSTGSIILGWASANVADSHEKKAVTLAMVNFSAVAANVYTAYLWPDSDSPRFIIGLGSSVGFSFVCGLVAIVAWYLFRRSNSKRLGEASGDNVKLYAI